MRRLTRGEGESEAERETERETERERERESSTLISPPFISPSLLISPTQPICLSLMSHMYIYELFQAFSSSDFATLNVSIRMGAVTTSMLHCLRVTLMLQLIIPQSRAHFLSPNVNAALPIFSKNKMAVTTPCSFPFHIERAIKQKDTLLSSGVLLAHCRHLFLSPRSSSGSH